MALVYSSLIPTKLLFERKEEEKQIEKKKTRADQDEETGRSLWGSIGLI
jgi:hypothetical protein